MRAERLSLYQASRSVGVSSSSVLRYGKSALRKLKNGRYAVKSSDQLLRVMRIPTPKGMTEIAVRGSREASKLATYSAAVDTFLATGNSSALESFRGQFITDASGAKARLLTDLKELDRLGSAGVLSFESLYAK
jgi:hypothetical protein